LYEQGEYYLAHEPLELAWMETESPERKLYQGILQIGLAYFQIRRGNYRGALKMFKRGNRNLTPLPDSYLGINIRKLQEDARCVESRLRELGSEQIANLTPELFKPLPYTGQENRL
jgi:predicted metal-dependent hydrolase